MSLQRMNKGPTGVWPRVGGFKVRNANHYTIEPVASLLRSAQSVGNLWLTLIDDIWWSEYHENHYVNRRHVSVWSWFHWHGVDKTENSFSRCCVFYRWWLDKCSSRLNKVSLDVLQCWLHIWYTTLAAARCSRNISWCYMVSHIDLTIRGNKSWCRVDAIDWWQHKNIYS